MPEKDAFRIGDFWLSKHSTSSAWQRTWYDAGTKQTRRQSLGTEDLQDAKDKLTEWFIGHHRPVDAKPTDTMVELVLTDYFTGHAVNKPSHVQAEIACGHLAAFFTGKTVADLTRREQERYIEARQKRGAAISTVSRELSVLRAALKRAWRLDELVSAPFIIDPDTAITKRSREPKGRPLTAGEMAHFLDAAKAPHGLLLLIILINTMCRPDAAMELAADQRDRENDLIDLNPKGRQQTKKHRPIVPVTKTLASWLDRREREMVGCRYYVAYGNRRIRSAKRFMRDTREAAGLDERVNLYSIRHTLARELRRRRVPTDEIELMLGHRLPGETTQIYAPYDPDYCRQASAAIDAYMADLQRLARVSLVLKDGGRDRD